MPVIQAFRMHSLIARMLVGACLLLLGPRVHAQISCTGNNSVANINFGNVLPLDNPSPSTSGSITISCTNNSTTTSYQVRQFPLINDGSGRASGAFSITPRYLLHTNGSDRIPFNLFYNASFTEVWPSLSTFTSGLPVYYTRTIAAGASTGAINPTVHAKLTSVSSTAIPGTYSSTFLNDTELRYSVGSAPATPAGLAVATNSPFNVTATVTLLAQCKVTAPSTLNFGSVSLSGSAPWDALVNNLQVQCTRTTPYHIKLNVGQNYLSTGATRQMASTTSGVPDKVAYALYQDSARTLPWGDTVNTNTLSGTGTGAAQAYTIYGRITALPVRPGAYIDTVTVVVTY